MIASSEREENFLKVFDTDAASDSHSPAQRRNGTKFMNMYKEINNIKFEECFEPASPARRVDVSSESLVKKIGSTEITAINCVCKIIDYASALRDVGFY